MPGQSAGSLAEKSPSRKATNAFKIWRDRASADLASEFRRAGADSRLPFEDVVETAAFRVGRLDFSFMIQALGSKGKFATGSGSRLEPGS